MNDSEWLAEPEAVTREDRIRALGRMVMVARPEFRPGRVPPMARALATIAATLLDHERRLPHEAPAVAAPQYTPAELVAIAAEEGREGPGPVLYPDAAPVLAFVAAIMANGLSVEVRSDVRTVTAFWRGCERLFSWEEIAAHATPLHRIADELRREFTTDAPAVSP